MQSNYVTLNQYYRNQFKLTESYEYNVGKFELSRSTDTPVLVKVSQVDPSLSNTTQYSDWRPFTADITLSVENIPADAEIKSVDLFMRYGDLWAPSSQPFNNQYLSYDKINKKITISKPNLAFSILSKPAPYASPLCNKITQAPCDPFARIYVTWG